MNERTSFHTDRAVGNETEVDTAYSIVGDLEDRLTKIADLASVALTCLDELEPSPGEGRIVTLLSILEAECEKAEAQRTSAYKRLHGVLYPH